MNKYEAVNREQLVDRLGSQCSPHRSYEGYLIGPDVTGRLCHVGSYRSLAAAQTAARALNEKEAAQ
jgi:hypothetical protein